MKTIKRIIAYLLTFTLLTGVVPAFSLAAGASADRPAIGTFGNHKDTVWYRSKSSRQVRSGDSRCHKCVE